MFTLLIQFWLVGTVALLVAMWIRDDRRQRRAAIEAGKIEAHQHITAMKARLRGEEAATIGTLMTARNLTPAPGGRWAEKDSLRGVPPRIESLRTTEENRAIAAGIILSTSISLAECSKRQRIQGMN